MPVLMNSSSVERTISSERPVASAHSLTSSSFTGSVIGWTSMLLPLDLYASPFLGLGVDLLQRLVPLFLRQRRLDLEPTSADGCGRELLDVIIQSGGQLAVFSELGDEKCDV